MSVQEMIQEARTLSAEDLKLLVEALVQMMPNTEPPAQKHSITELRGLGKELWQGIDAQAYVNQLRSE